MPGFKNVPTIRYFTGLRPYTNDGLPILGSIESVKSFIMAAGHKGDGVALAPITGKLISELALKKQSSIPLDAFNLARFNK